MTVDGARRSRSVSAVEEFTRRWAGALGEACYLTTGTTGDPIWPRTVSEDMAELLADPPLDRARARELGARLATGTQLGSDGLVATLRVLREHGAALLAPPGCPPDQVGGLLDEIAAGYSDGLRERSQAQQEKLLGALLRSRRGTEDALRDSEKRFRAVFTEAGVGIALIGLDGRVMQANPVLYRLFQAHEGADTAQPLIDHVHPEDSPAIIAEFRELTSGARETTHGEMRFVRQDGTVIWAYVTSTLVRGIDKRPDYVIGVVEDVTDRHQLRSRLRHQTYHDQLTRLPNRALMNEQLRWAFSPESEIGRVGLCHLDLDGFRAVNDSLGQQVGDQLLYAVAGRLQLLTGGNLVTRIGGDEFAILVTDPPDVATLCRLGDQLLSGLRPAFMIGSQRLSINASLGIAEAEVTETWPGELQRAADAARSWAKKAGGGRWAVFDAERDAGETTRFALAAGIAGAVDREEFALHYQPLVDLATGTVTGVEALVRWRHPEHGLLAPARFIDLAERNGAIVPLGRWVLAEACRQARHWADELGTAAPYVSVNVAPRQLAEPGWLAEVDRVLGDTGLEPGRLQLEITERAVLVDEWAAGETLATLRGMGVRLAIDDFGTGYSSLSYLRRLPVHTLKIDGAFIKGLREAGRSGARDGSRDAGPAGTPPRTTRSEAAAGAGSPDSKIVAALISMAHALEMTVTAEWVETAGQARLLRGLGCDAGQGTWFGAPVPAAAITPMLGEPLAG